MIDAAALFYAANQNIISVFCMITPIAALMFRHRRQWQSVDWRNIMAAGAYGAGLEMGSLLILAASASNEVAAKIALPPQITILGGLSIIYAYRGLESLWQLQLEDNNTR